MSKNQTKKIKITKRKNKRERNKKTYKKNKKAKRKIIKTRKILNGGANDNKEAKNQTPEDIKLDNTERLIDIIKEPSTPITLIFLSGERMKIYPAVKSWRNYTVLDLKLHILREIINPGRIAEIDVISNNPSDTQTVLFNLYRHSDKNHLRLVYVTGMDDLKLFNNIINLVNKLFSFKAHWDEYYDVYKPTWRGVPTYEADIYRRKDKDINWPGFFNEFVSSGDVRTSAYKFAMYIIIYDLIYSYEINNTLNDVYKLNTESKKELVDNMIEVVEKFEPVLRNSTRHNHREWAQYFNDFQGLFNSSDPSRMVVDEVWRKNHIEKRVLMDQAPPGLGGDPIIFYKKCLTLYVLFDKLKLIFGKVLALHSPLPLALHNPLPFILRTEKTEKPHKDVERLINYGIIEKQEGWV